MILVHVRLYAEDRPGLGVADQLITAADGLTLFFALSGFLLFRPFAAAIISDAPRPGAGAFFRNRALRIYPAYVVILLLSSFLLQTTNAIAASRDNFDTWQSALGTPDAGTLLVDLTLLQTLFPDTLLTGLGVAWSLTTELCFYLALPLLAAAATALARRVHRLVAVAFVPAVLFTVGFAGKALISITRDGIPQSELYASGWGATWHAVFERSILVHADLFGWGALAAILFVLVERQMLTDRGLNRVRVGAIAATLVGALTASPGLLGPLGAVLWRPTVTAAACAGLILWATLPSRSGGPSMLGRALETRPLAFSGLVSYSAYLWHLPVLWWLTNHGWLVPSTPLGLLANFVIVLAATLVLATITYRLVEAPALKLKKRTDGGRVTAASPDAEVTRA